MRKANENAQFETRIAQLKDLPA